VRWLAVVLLAEIMASGCSRYKPATTAKADNPNATTGTAAAAVPDVPVPLDPRLHQPFADATISEPPAEWHRPPDTTMTGKSVGKLYTDVVRTWDEIKFQSPTGKPLAYKALLDTDMGQIEITLLPEVAPNHVRSFVALAKVGYFDGLVFDRTIHQDVDGRPDAKLDLIEGGCPLGTGEAGYGSIGYWLKPEFSAHVSHEEGTVGASHGEEADTAACKFYINLDKAPFMDGNYTIFGKVTQGLSVAKKILSLPVRTDAEYPEGDRPVQPVVIRKVSVAVEEVEKLAAK
jgi:peptidyl-prolyl cis-trans isomerase B (cyclophilin B)